MFEQIKARGPRTQLYLVKDIEQALNAAELAITSSDGQRALDVIAANFGLRRTVQYDLPKQVIIEAPARKLLA